MSKPMRKIHVLFWIIFILLPILFIFSRSLTLLYNTSTQHTKQNKIVSYGKTLFNIEEENKTSNDVLIIGYIRGGSTFLGELLGVREGSFYLYEPLFGLSKLGYFKPGLHCNMMDTYCGDAKRMDMVALGILRSIYSCDFRLLKTSISLWSFAKGRGNFNWTQSLLDCHGKEDGCFEKQAKRCAAARSRVTKVVRASISLVGIMLEKYPKLKIVHLLRDPRAILHSRMNIWPVDTKNTLESARSVCKKMKEDFKEAQVLNKRFPDRVSTLFYEDLAVNPMKVTKDLFKFLNYSFTKSDEDRIQLMTESNVTIPKKEQKWSLLKKNSSDTARKWRSTIPGSVAYLTSLGCYEILEIARYPDLKNKNDLINGSIPLRRPYYNNSLLNDRANDLSRV